MVEKMMRPSHGGSQVDKNFYTKGHLAEVAERDEDIYTKGNFAEVTRAQDCQKYASSIITLGQAQSLH